MAVAKSVKRTIKLVVLLQVLMLIFFRLLNFHCAFSMFIFYSDQDYVSYHRCPSAPAVLYFWDQHASITFRYSYAYCFISDSLRLAFTLNLSFFRCMSLSLPTRTSIYFAFRYCSCAHAYCQPSSGCFQSVNDEVYCPLSPWRS